MAPKEVFAFIDHVLLIKQLRQDSIESLELRNALDHLLNKMQTRDSKRKHYNYMLRNSRSGEINNYSKLKHIVNELHLNPQIISLLKSILATTWPTNLAQDLNNVDSSTLQSMMQGSINQLDTLQFISSDRACYVLLIYATFAIKFYVERIMLGCVDKLEYRVPTRAEAVADFRRLRESYPIDPPEGANTVGKTASDFFTLKYRVDCPYQHKNGTYAAKVTSPLLINTIINYWKNRKPSEQFIKKISGYIPNEFRPKYVKDLVHTLSKKSNTQIKKVFNPTGGWGARLIGAMATEDIECYGETDPNPFIYHEKFNMIAEYGDQKNSSLQVTSLSIPPTEQQEDVKGIQVDHRCNEKTKKYYLFNQPIEDLAESQLRPNGEGYDLVFYSPPYFDKEQYQDVSGPNPLQSYRRYPKFNNWLKGFLYPCINQSYTALKYGGFMAINISRIPNHNPSRPKDEFDLPIFLKNYIKSQLPYFSEAINYCYSNRQAASLVYVYQKLPPLNTQISLNIQTQEPHHDKPSRAFKRKFPSFFDSSSSNQFGDDEENKHEEKIQKLGSFTS